MGHWALTSLLIASGEFEVASNRIVPTLDHLETSNRILDRIIVELATYQESSIVKNDNTDLCFPHALL
jgi:hypothetical protein